MTESPHATVAPIALAFSATEEECVPLTAGSRDCVRTRQLYFRGLGLIYLLAFLSLWSQIHGLIGSQGILPVEKYFNLAQEKLGDNAWHLLPSLCWLASSDLMLHGWCLLGVGLSVALFFGLAPRLILVLLWLTYLSLSVAGQAFLSFQWDSLLLEMTVCSIFYAPRGFRPNWLTAPEPRPIARWLLWGLAFKLMFLSGITKLLSGDWAWSDGTALQFHYFTQPIPSWVSWYCAQLPQSVHQASLMVMFAIELPLTFLIFTGKHGRAVFGLATIALMILIEATGNFGFFNLQTIVLAIPLLNDQILSKIARWIPSRLTWFQPPSPIVPLVTADPIWRRVITVCIGSLILGASGLTLVREMVRTLQADKMPALVISTLNLSDRLLLSWGEPWVLNRLAPYRSINGYGLFRVMTTHRPEIILEISQDAKTWESCEFPYKPGKVDRPPPIVAPHMPRLDWQMWFAGLNPRGNEYWLFGLSQRILEGNPSIARLMGRPNLMASPPRYVRWSYYEYKYSTPEQRQATGAWWSRSHTGFLTGPLSRRSDSHE
ncbi:MAG: lipase maturation factor family protein [Planctomycetota bacterium]